MWAVSFPANLRKEKPSITNLPGFCNVWREELLKFQFPVGMFLNIYWMDFYVFDLAAFIVYVRINNDKCSPGCKV